ncbi:MAG: cell division protein FtsZ [Candidatus Harrisonbacteria bacterium CG10_big_fil_rev_8_21_14_0_10_45_28]|uniref:Cell division protein FtsZ n=1 Tax=Candidatus Harrisonbacteria bacterium CG10_big_fil_rev_8_21_14_0_10_45_28 TaxID=1974586 RepID=A0A2H0UPX0_9BACT|nr:MAG: cell division protein FtsZ [Candidatus Harrisonbacteria bacterium CG10_big_fil_rev_8_21_14_0_10_45_28]
MAKKTKSAEKKPAPIKAVSKGGKSKAKTSIKKKAPLKTKKSGKISSAMEGYHISVKVFGVGGGGGNAINRMNESFGFRSMDLVGVNTDSLELEKCHIRKKIHIGKNLTRGRGTGMNPELGRQAAEENRSEIVEAMKGADLVFISAGLGGGTGSGATPIIADAAKEAGALTVAIITKPFVFEGTQRAKIAEDALNQIRERVDAFIVVPNDRVFNVIKKETPTNKAFERIDDILREAIIGITELISSQGLINVDFSDIQTIMREAGPTLIGVGIASGQNRAVTAAGQAVNSPLLEFSIEGAQGILFGVSGGKDMKMSEINEIAKTITATIDPNAKIIFGAYYDRRLKKGQIKVTLIATGFSGTVSKSDMDDMLPVSGLFSDLDVEKTDAPRSDTRIKTKNEINEPVETRKTKNIFEKPVASKPEKKMETKEQAPHEMSENEKDDIWEIPAFLRKKKR